MELEPGERRLRFVPAVPWRRGETYVLRVAELLEDVAGNRPGRAFEAPPDALEVATFTWPMRRETLQVPNTRNSAVLLSVSSSCTARNRREQRHRPAPVSIRKRTEAQHAETEAEQEHAQRMG